jgi:hypothetical protein
MLMAINMKMYDDSFITLMMEVVKAFETTINIYQSTRCYFPEDSPLSSSCLDRQQLQS